MYRQKSLNKIFTISNILTGSRIVLAPFIVFYLLQQAWSYALALFFVAGISDLLDGFIARLFNEPTWLGAVLDPIADKLLVVSSLGAFLISCPDELLPTWFVTIIAIREAILLGGGVILYLMKPSLQIEPTWWGKITTFLTLSLMMLVLAKEAFGYPFTPFFPFLQGAILGCAAFSFLQYFFKGLSLARS